MYKYILTLAGKTVKEYSDAVSCAAAATHITENWKQIEMFTNEPNCEFIHFKFKKDL